MSGAAETTHLKPLLAIETSGNSLGVALRTNQGIVFNENITEGMIHGRALVPLMKTAIASLGIHPAELGGVAVSHGPGSWTGLRIGISAAKAFAWASHIALVCVPSFEAMALEACGESEDGVALTLRDARSEGFFAAIIEVTAGAPRRLLDECVLKPADVIEAAIRAGKMPLNVCGDEKCLAAIAPEIAAHGWTARHDIQSVAARAIAECGWRRLQSGEGVARSAAEIHHIGPLYLRASDPELKLRQSAVA